MDPEDVINLFDSCWFNYEILKKDQPFKPNLSSSSSSSPDPIRFSSLRSILVRSKSDDIGSFNYGSSSFSPNSVLFTIPSLNSEDSTTQKQVQVHEEAEISTTTDRGKEQSVVLKGEKKNKNKKKRRTHGVSKSLSELEFEELKGFMDLGFVFSEQDYKDSTLVEIIPGLQRLGEERESDNINKNNNNNKDSSISTSTRRPYLSEAWENINMDRKLLQLQTVPLLKWEIPVVKDEIDMKDNLKLWAHTVASYVR